MSSVGLAFFKKWIVFPVFSIIGIVIIFYLIDGLIAKGFNPAGVILFASGVFISSFGFLSILYGNQEVDEPFSLWENESVIISQQQGKPERVLYPFRLETPSMIKGHVSGERVRKFILAEFFGAIENVSRDNIVRPKTYLEKKGPPDSGGKEISFGPFRLPSGTYVFQFGEIVNEIKASFTLKGTYRKKPYEYLYHLGLTLSEIGVPILITGLISIGYGVLV